MSKDFGPMQVHSIPFFARGVGPQNKNKYEFSCFVYLWYYLLCMKILITGVAGAIGSHVAEHFAGLEHEVVGVDILTPYYDRAIKEINLADVTASGAEVHLCDLAVDDIDHLMKGVDVVFSLCGSTGYFSNNPV